MSSFIKLQRLPIMYFLITKNEKLSLNFKAHGVGGEKKKKKAI